MKAHGEGGHGAFGECSGRGLTQVSWFPQGEVGLGWGACSCPTCRAFPSGSCHWSSPPLVTAGDCSVNTSVPLTLEDNSRLVFNFCLYLTLCGFISWHLFPGSSGIYSLFLQRNLLSRVTCLFVGFHIFLPLPMDMSISQLSIPAKQIIPKLGDLNNSDMWEA